MPRKTRIANEVLAGWFEQTAARKTRYAHRLLREVAAKRVNALPQLKAYVAEAHEDAKRKLAKAAEPTLTPFKAGAPTPRLDGYPDQLHINVQKGYLGEVLAGMIAEHFDVHKKDGWKVPLFLFRYHRIAFQYLEQLRHLSQKQRAALKPKDRPGRTGNDALAFTFTKKGRIGAVLVCEAKCRSTMSAKELEKAHKSLSQLEPCPSGVLELMEALQDYNTANSRRWLKALYEYRKSGYKNTRRYCLFLWARNGTRPKPRLPRTKPHKGYSGSLSLEAVEMVLVGLTDFVTTVYTK